MMWIFLFLHSLHANGAVPPSFVEIRKVDPTIQVEARYASSWNFLGRPLKGYFANKCYLTREAAARLALAQKSFIKSGYSILAFDCYRPVQAVNDIMTWLPINEDQKMKSVYYAEELKHMLSQRGYIASRSGHSRGSTIDLTLVRLSSPRHKSSTDHLTLAFKELFGDCRITTGIESTGQVDMGTYYDCFSIRSATLFNGLSNSVKENRMLLKTGLEAVGFKNYSKEWWHFSLINEPHPTTFFDFEIKP